MPYCCYLLQSESRKHVSYIGSTPDPERRLRQHNGSRCGGAKKTISNRPWRIIALVHGFADRISTLQFEWHWQNPQQSRLLKAYRKHDDRKDAGRRRRPKRLYAVSVNFRILCRLLLSSAYSRLPLQVSIFDDDWFYRWTELLRLESARIGHSLPRGVTCRFIPGGFQGQFQTHGMNAGIFDSYDALFAQLHVEKWRYATTSVPVPKIQCSICFSPVSPAHVSNYLPLDVNQTILLCPQDGCLTLSHMKCLAEKFLSESKTDRSPLIPVEGTCRGCKRSSLWCDYIRGLYARKNSSYSNDYSSLADSDSEVELVNITTNPTSSLILIPDSCSDVSSDIEIQHTRKDCTYVLDSDADVDYV